MRPPSPFEHPTLRSDLPNYPVHMELLRVTGGTIPGPAGYASSSVLGPSLFLGFVQQLDPTTLLPRDRVPCLVLDSNRQGLGEGYCTGRLAGSYQSLPVYEAGDSLSVPIAYYTQTGMVTHRRTAPSITNQTNVQRFGGAKWMDMGIFGPSAQDPSFSEYGVITIGIPPTQAPSAPIVAPAKPGETDSVTGTASSPVYNATSNFHIYGLPGNDPSGDANIFTVVVTTKDETKSTFLTLSSHGVLDLSASLTPLSDPYYSINGTPGVGGTDPVGNVFSGGIITEIGSGGGGADRTEGTVAAAGSNQGDAAAITTDAVNVTGASGTAGVILPNTTAGLIVVRNNEAINDLFVYPPSGAAIGILGTNNPDTLGGSSVKIYARISSTLWGVF